MMRKNINIVLIESEPKKVCDWPKTKCVCPNYPSLGEMYSGKTSTVRKEDEMRLEQAIMDAEIDAEKEAKKEEMEKALAVGIEKVNVRDLWGLDEPEPPAKPLLVFVYDVDFVTQLGWQNIEKIAKLDPKLLEGCEAIEDFLEMVADKFTWLNERGRNVMHYKDAVEEEETDYEYKRLELTAEVYGTLIKREFINEMEEFETYPELCDAFFKLQEVFQARLEKMKQCLKLASDFFMSKRGENVVITEDTLEYGVGQMLTSGMSDMVPLANVYSTHRKSREDVLRRVQATFNDAVYFVVVSSNDRTIKAARNLNIPVWPIDQDDSLDIFYNVQREYLLK